MPNWTNCELTIGGPATELARLLAIIFPDPEAVKSDYHGDRPDVELFARLHPMPPEYQHTVSGTIPLTAGDGGDWNSWQHANWGVKWGDCGTRLEGVSDRLGALAAQFRTERGISSTERPVHDETIHLTFDTPWSLPAEGLQEISLRWPLLRFQIHGEYEDGGGDSLQFGPHRLPPTEENIVAPDPLHRRTCEEWGLEE